MKLLKLPKPDKHGNAIYVMSQDDCKRGVELLYKKEAPIRYFRLDMLNDCEWWGWVDLTPAQVIEVMALEVVNVNKKLKGHQRYAKRILEEK